MQTQIIRFFAITVLTLGLIGFSPYQRTEAAISCNGPSSTTNVIASYGGTYFPLAVNGPIVTGVCVVLADGSQVTVIDGGRTSILDDCYFVLKTPHFALVADNQYHASGCPIVVGIKTRAVHATGG